MFSFFLSENYTNRSYSNAVFGGCDALRRHFGILADGKVTTCCLDYNGENIVGNVRSQKLIDILETDQVRSIRRNFDRYHPPTELCKRCLGSPNILLSFAKQFSSVGSDLIKRIKAR